MPVTEPMSDVYYTYLPSPVGPFLIAGNETALAFTGFTTGHQQRKPRPQWAQDAAPLKQAVEQFAAYFEGEAITFKLKLAPVGTPFQLAVWSALQSIPYGTTWSYGQVAKHLGNPGGGQAVGAANAANHLPIVIPCHRVIGSNGKLTGFGGGLETKAALLRLEKATLAERGGQMLLI